MTPQTPVVPLDPSLAAIAASIEAHGNSAPFSGTPEQARERMRRAVLAARMRTPLLEVGSIEDTMAYEGELRVPVRIYHPPGRQRPRPITLFFHGGGFVLGSIELMDDIARKLCRDVDAVVVSVEYRLAPEHPFPAAHDDAVAAASWMLRHVQTLGGHEGQVGVAGESAGANLATSAAIVLRDRGASLAAQLLVVPGVDFARDLTAIGASGRAYPMLSAVDLSEIARLYMGQRSDLAECFPPSPLRASSLAGLPPAVIGVAGHDPLRAEGVAYATRLRSAGVPVDLLPFGDMFHPFFGLFAASDAARRANDSLCRAFAARLHGALVDASIPNLTKERS